MLLKHLDLRKQIIDRADSQFIKKEKYIFLLTLIHIMAVYGKQLKALISLVVKILAWERTT
jgi:hypothetical protein